ncbi:MAG: DUF349 domain-containing protein [Bacteroidia bacterium]
MTEQDSTEQLEAQHTEIPDTNENHQKQTDKEELSFDEEALQKLDLDSLMLKAKETLLLQPAVALKHLNAIRLVMNSKLQDLEGEENIAENKWEQDFKQFHDLAMEARSEEKRRIEAEKKANHQKKLTLLETLENLVKEDETEQTIARVKEIQKEWKSIRVLPNDVVQDLWDSYHRLLDEFYDKHSINIELKELDRKKNLEAKIELTKKVEALSQEKSIKRSYILLNKYHEEFRNTGPVPKESREGIWQAFKAASDHIYKEKKDQLEEINKVRDENQKLKQLIIDKAALIAQIPYDSIKLWNTKTKEFDALFQEWKSIGPVPQKSSDQIWQAFRKERSLFQSNKKTFFHSLNQDRKKNLALKEALCEKVEALKDEEDFVQVSKAIISIQEEWKKIGPVPDKVNKAIWNRFRAACDHFFNRRNTAQSAEKEEQKANLNVKQELLKELGALLESDLDEKESFEKYKIINTTWNQTGKVPIKALKKLRTNHEKLSDGLFKKFKKNKAELKESELGEHYQQLANAPQGDKRLKDEEYKLKKRIKYLSEEVLNQEQNLSFFAKSKNADALLKDFEQKIAKSKSQIERLKKQLSHIRTALRSVV